MQSSSHRHATIACSLLLVVMGLLTSPLPRVAAAQAPQPAAAAQTHGALSPQAGRGQQILYADAGGRLHIQCWDSTIFEDCWSSPDDGWTNAVTGDFNGDGKDEIVATKGGVLKTFNPVSGTDPAVINGLLAPGYEYHQLVVGDFMGLGYRQVMASFRSVGQGLNGPEAFLIYAYARGQGAGGTRSYMGPTFNYAVQAAAAGRVNGDALDDLVSLPVHGNHVNIVYGNQDVTTMNYIGNWYDQVFPRSYNVVYDWFSVVVGDVAWAHSGNEVVFSTKAYAPDFSLWVAEYGGHTSIMGSNHGWSVHPYYTSLGLADVNGDGFKEILGLQDLTQIPTTTPFLVLYNVDQQDIPAFEVKGFDGVNVWSKVVGGDVDWDSKDEVVVLSSHGLRVYYQPDVPWNNYASGQLQGQFSTNILAVANFGFPNLRLAVSPPALNFEGVRGQVLRASLDLESQPVGFNYAWAAQPLGSSSWIHFDAASGSAPATLAVSIDTNSPLLQPGTNTGMIRITTSSQGITAPRYVDIPVHVQFPILGAGPSSGITFDVPGEQYFNTLSQSVSVSNISTPANVDWTATLIGNYISPQTHRQWLTLPWANGQTPGSLALRASPADAGVGQLQAQVRFDSAYGSATIPVVINVGDPGMLVDREQVDFAYGIGRPTTEPQAATIQVQAPGVFLPALDWSVSFAGSQPTWLKLDKTSGQTSRPVPDAVTLTVDAASAAAGGPGIRRAQLSFVTGSTVRTVNVSLLVFQDWHSLYLPLVAH